MRWTDDGSVIVDNSTQLENEERPISISREPDSNATEERPPSLEKQKSPIICTDAGMTIDFKAE
jgi:hypothetical protein